VPHPQLTLQSRREAHRRFAGEEWHLKIAVSMVLLFGFLASQSALAKPAHAPAHTPSGGAAPAKGTNAGGAKPAPEPIDADVTVVTPRTGFTPVNRNANASLKIVKPENFTRRPDITTPIKPVVRNAIGQPVQPRSVMIETPRLPPPVQVPVAVPKAIPRSVVPVPPISPSTAGRMPLHPSATMGLSSTGRIDGTHLIRPSAASQGIGGPAHPIGGINGTTVRTTR
jgi:hypothetical protein